MTEQLNSKLQKYLNRHFTEFNSSILPKKIANSNGDEHSLLDILQGQLDNSRGIRQELSSFTMSERKELKMYLQNSTKRIEIKLKFYGYLYLAMPLIVGIIVLWMRYFLTANYIINIVLATLSILVIIWAISQERKLLALKLEYELLLTYLK